MIIVLMLWLALVPSVGAENLSITKCIGPPQTAEWHTANPGWDDCFIQTDGNTYGQISYDTEEAMSQHVYLDLTGLRRTGAERDQAPYAADVLAWACFGLLLAVDLTLAWR